MIIEMKKISRSLN